MTQLSPITGFFFVLILGEAVGASAVIWDQQSLLLKCLLGSILASIALIAWRGLDRSDDEAAGQQHLRRLCREFLISVIAGITGTPLVFNYLGLQPNSDLVVGMSAAVSFSATTALRIGWPLVQQAYKRWAEGKLGAGK